MFDSFVELTRAYAYARGTASMRWISNEEQSSSLPRRLLAYGDDLSDNFRRAASYVDRILKGTKPNELPVQAPVKFELVINLKTAKALGLDVPLHLLSLPKIISARIDDVGRTELAWQ